MRPPSQLARFAVNPIRNAPTAGGGVRNAIGEEQRDRVGADHRLQLRLASA